MIHGINQIQKRDGSIVAFKQEKISNAIYKAMQAVDNGSQQDADNIALQVMGDLAAIREKDRRYVPSIEGIQNMVEDALMSSSFHDVAKAYILYRNEHARQRQTNIFEKRVNLKPYEYPDFCEYVDAIRHSYWVHTEFNFTSDIQDFKSSLSVEEKEAIKRTMLAISQIEVAVKTFWGNIYSKMPKPEIGAVGATFSESEVRHSDAYSHLLEILGLNNEFEALKDNPVIMKRVRYLDMALKNANSDDNRDYAESILLFALFIEHVSLFSQFLIIMSFNKHRSLLKGISNVVEATSKEEQIHGNFGVDLIKQIKRENPSWFDETHAKTVSSLCRQAMEAESEVIDWIFEHGELSFLPKDQIREFIKQRFNQSLSNIDIAPVFEIDESLLEKTEWFDDEIMATKHVDFFVKRSINYNKRQQSVTADDLF
ncbi:ribonucleotide-diphosphate reductase subunit beta [Veronia pacifica]|uniref:ribonucleoside-diphosphate reductase n=1 Tax=Veronia pacifica TaxID=1080227 RepID=A0A1C3ESH4_9GAMM|nr:ribonucleotide-diphosphate reductase subunit beta [Veronia pacifica]ODA36247.1 ribonucleotide reductase [Veronia pacifica]